MKSNLYQKGISEIIIVIIIGAVLAVGMFLFFRMKFPPTETPELSETYKKATEEEPVSPEIEDEWQTFEVEKYGFSMKIPADYQKESFIETDPEEIERMLLVAFFKKDDNQSFTLSISDEGEKDAKEAKETYQLEFERREFLVGKHLFPDAKLISIQKLEKKECPIFIFSQEKDDKTFFKLVFAFPTYREELVFKMGFDYPDKNKKKRVSEMINSIECSSQIKTPAEAEEWCPIGTYANFGGSDQYKITGIEKHKLAGEDMDLCCGERTAASGRIKGRKCIDMPTGDYDYLIMWIASSETGWLYEKMSETFPQDGQSCMTSFENGEIVGTVCLPK